MRLRAAFIFRAMLIIYFLFFDDAAPSIFRFRRCCLYFAADMLILICRFCRRLYASRCSFAAARRLVTVIISTMISMLTPCHLRADAAAPLFIIRYAEGAATSHSEQYAARAPRRAQHVAMFRHAAMRICFSLRA